MTFDPTFLRMLLELIVWGFGIYLAVRMLKNGGSSAEKLLLAGCIVMFIETAVHPLVFRLVIAAVYKGHISAPEITYQELLVDISFTLIKLTGLVCLVLGFWKRFISGSREAN